MATGAHTCTYQSTETSSMANWETDADADLWKTRYESVRVELDEFTANSSELEQELEKELHLSLQQNKRLQTDLSISHDEITMLKENSRRSALQISSLQLQLRDVENQKNLAASRLRQVEQENDTLEIANRNLEASVSGYLGQIEELTEAKTIVETEKQNQTQLQKETEQRLQDEIKDLKDELSAIRKRSVPSCGSQEMTSAVLRYSAINASDKEIMRLRLLADGDFAAADQLSTAYRAEAETNVCHTLASGSSAAFHALIDRFKVIDFPLTADYESVKKRASRTTWN